MAALPETGDRSKFAEPQRLTAAWMLAEAVVAIWSVFGGFRCDRDAYRSHFVADSPLEERGFEPSVPRQRSRNFLGFLCAGCHRPKTECPVVRMKKRIWRASARPLL